MATKQSKATELRNFLGLKQAHQLLESEVEGLYEEMDKLAKKSAVDAVTELQLKAINSLITKSKQLLSDDVIIGEVMPFVPAGDNPEYRDVVTVLRQLLQGLQRFKRHDYKFLWSDDFEEELEDNELDEDDAKPLFKSIRP